MNLKLVECQKKYWEFVRLLRTDEKNQKGFFSVVVITPEEQEIYMTKNSHFYKICLFGDIPVGYVGIIKNSEITYCVHPDFAGRGIGTYMVDEFTKTIDVIDAYVKVENIASQKVFEKLGWTKQIYYKKNK